jgi:hypothetical protein
MSIIYLLLQPGSGLPDISALSPFRSVTIIEGMVPSTWRSLVSDWLIKSGCLYIMVWGKDCEIWHDSFDWANIEEFAYTEIPEDKFILTTWHENEALDEVFWFSKNLAFHPKIELVNTLILHVSNKDREAEFISKYAGA